MKSKWKCTKCEEENWTPDLEEMEIIEKEFICKECGETISGGKLLKK